MKRIEKTPALVVAVVSALAAGGGLHLLLTLASPGQVGRVGGLLVWFGALGLLFTGGVVVGALFLHRSRGGHGDDPGGGRGGGGEPPAPDGPPPGADPLDLELQRLLEQETTRLP